MDYLEAGSQWCHCWYVFDRNEGRTETERSKPREDCSDCDGKGVVPRQPQPVTERLSRDQLEAICQEEGVPIAPHEWDAGMEHGLRLALGTAFATGEYVAQQRIVELEAALQSIRSLAYIGSDVDNIAKKALQPTAAPKETVGSDVRP